MAVADTTIKWTEHWPGVPVDPESTLSVQEVRIYVYTCMHVLRSTYAAIMMPMPTMHQLKIKLVLNLASCCCCMMVTAAAVAMPSTRLHTRLHM